MTNKIDYLWGDALELLPKQAPFDAIITDPPYSCGISNPLKGASSVTRAREMIDAMGQSLVAAVLRLAPKREPFSVFLMTDWRQVSFFAAILRDMGLEQQSCIVWDKQRSSLSPYFHPRHEMILFAHRSAPGGKKAFSGYLGQDIISCPRMGKERDHPFAKPPELAFLLLNNFTPGRILDPFCGTGGLLRGAASHGWNCVGIDIDQKNIAAARAARGDAPKPLSVVQ